MSSAAGNPMEDRGPQVNPGADRLELGDDPSPEELEADIARTRQELGETVEALSEKLDPKVQADRQLEHLKERARDQVGHAREQVDHARESAQSTLTHAKHVVADSDSSAPGLIAAAAGAALFAAVGLLIIGRR